MVNIKIDYVSIRSSQDKYHLTHHDEQVEGKWGATHCKLHDEDDEFNLECQYRAQYWLCHGDEKDSESLQA